VLLSGSIGDHGIAILAQREGLEFETQIQSDSAALHTLVADMLGVTSNVTPDIRCMRDPTRGGVSSTLNEIAERSQVGIELEESSLPIHEEVRGACELLGLDPLYVANEGKLIAIVAPEAADAVLQTMRRHPLGGEARMIGTVKKENPGLVTMRTPFGTTRIVDMLAGDQLPRIC
jgi:hydrogenase expression/formation protein HypE